MKYILLSALLISSLSLKISKNEPSYENAQLIYDFFIERGWTVRAICGMLGNMHWESDGIQSDIDETGGTGYGLVQWTPGTKLKEWAEQNGLDYKTVNTQCQRIQWELENNVQYIKSKCTYDNFTVYSQSQDSVEELTECFMREYERPYEATNRLAYRKTYAKLWYGYFIKDSEPLIFTYQVTMSDGTMSKEIQSDGNSFAGVSGLAITNIAIKVNKGLVKYQVHVISKNRWFGIISNFDWNDYDYGYSGIGKPIDNIRITHNEIEPYYRVSPLNGEFGDWCKGNSSSCVGTNGTAIDRIQISLFPSSSSSFFYSSRLFYNIFLLLLIIFEL